MASLSPFWKLLESRNDRTAVLAEWQQRAGDVFKAIRPLLAPTGTHAGSYPHPKPHGMPLRVIKHRDGSLVAVCPEDSDIRIELAKPDIALYRADMERLRKELAVVFSLSPARSTIDSMCDSILLGKYRPKAAANFPVHLVIAKQRSFSAIVKDLCESEKPFILLATSSAYCAEDLGQRLDKQKAVLVLLDDVIACRAGRFQYTDQWSEYLSAFAQRVNPTSRSNFSNKPTKKGAKLAANIKNLKNELIEYIRSQYKHIYSQQNRGFDPAPVTKLQKKQLGEAVGIRPDEVTRAFDEDPYLEQLLTISSSNDEILKYGKTVKA